MNLKARLQYYKNLHGVSWEIIEQDYVLSWILAGICQIEPLKTSLVFKGGTCLRKCYFGDYRFSQDLDMSVIRNSEYLRASLCNHIIEACRLSEALIQKQGEALYLKCSPYTQKHPHPEGQQAFVIEAKMPWQREFLTKAYVEISFEEKVILPSIERAIIHPYDSFFDFCIQTYDLNEVVAEKIRALLQFSKKLHERGWARSRVRDDYDLWSILSTYKEKIDTEALPELVHQKCAAKGIVFNGIEDIFNNTLMKNAQQEWERWLKDIVIPFLPDRTMVLESLQKNLGNIFAHNSQLERIPQ